MDKLFDNSYVHQIDVRLSDEDWDALLTDPVSKTNYTADVTIDGEVFSKVTFSTKGNSSLFFVAYGPEESKRYSFKINLGKQKKGKSYYGLDKLSLNNLFCDNTYMKDTIAYDLFRKMNIPAPLVSYVWLTVNGEDRGLYMAIEDLDKSFLQRALHGEGVSYAVERSKKPMTQEIVNKVMMNGLSVPSVIHGADLVYSTENLADYADIVDNASTKATAYDHRLVIRALQALAGEENLDMFFDTDEISRFFAVHNFLLNYDSYTGTQLNNLDLYEKDGRLSIIPWDYNLSFGTIPTVIGPELLSNPTAFLNTGIDTPLIRTTEDQRPLWNLIRNHENYLDSYHEAMETLAAHVMSDECETELNRLHDMLLPYVQKDPTAFCTAEEYEKACETLKQFCLRRAESIRRQLAGDLAMSSEFQDPHAMVDALDLRVIDMGAFLAGTME